MCCNRFDNRTPALHVMRVFYSLCVCECECNALTFLWCLHCHCPKPDMRKLYTTLRPIIIHWCMMIYVARVSVCLGVALTCIAMFVITANKYENHFSLIQMQNNSINLHSFVVGLLW